MDIMKSRSRNQRISDTQNPSYLQSELVILDKKSLVKKILDQAKHTAI